MAAKEVRGAKRAGAGPSLPWLTASGGFMQHLEPIDRDHLLALATIRSVQKGDFIFRAGSYGENVYILEAGRIKVAQVAPAGREIILWFCFPGEVFGLTAVPGTGPRMVFARACTDVRLHCIARTKFLSFLLSNPRVSIELVNLVLGRLYLLCDALLNITTESAEIRLRNMLRRLSNQYGRTVGGEVCLDIPLTQQDLADMIGASRQTVSGLLNRMKDKGLVRARGRRIYVRKGALKPT
jgi:CRP/FNR family transcriptional regulator, cyclic AMP receptor protein